MGYILLHFIFSPFLLLLRYFLRSGSSDQKDLVIQTAKIGDCLNSTPLFSALDHFDLVCEKSCLDVVKSFPGIGSIFILDEYRKTGLYGKLRLSFILFGNNYSSVYVLQPNALNLFLAEMAYPGKRVSIDVEYKKSHISGRFCARNQCVRHSKDDLVLDTYLRMLSTPDYGRKKSYHGSRRPEDQKAQLLDNDLFYIGISLSAGNKMKSLPDNLTCALLRMLEKYRNARVLFFGIQGEENYLKNLEVKGCLNMIDYVDLIGDLDLGETAWFLSNLNLYVSSDTGLSYLADTLEVPLINFMGPCSYQEQRPLGENVLIVKTPGLDPFSFIFDAPYSATFSSDELYHMDTTSMKSVENFIGEMYTDFQSH